MFFSKWLIVPSLCAAIAMGSASDALAAKKSAAAAKKPVAASKPALKPASASKPKPHGKKSKKGLSAMSKKITLKPAAIKKHLNKHKKHKKHA